MTILTVAAVQMNSQQDIDANLAAISKSISQAKSQGAQFVVLPENCCSMGEQPATAERFDELSSTIADFAKDSGIHVLAGTLPCPYRPDGARVPDGRLRQVSQLFAPDGSQVARYDKIHLFTATVGDKQGRYDEAATFEAGDKMVVAPIATDNGTFWLGMMVCFDLRFPALSQRLRQSGAEILTAPSAFTYLTGQAHWSLLLKARAIDSQCLVVGAAQGGEHQYKSGTARQTWGHAGISNFKGEMVAQYEQSALSDNDAQDGFALVTASLDLAAQNEGRQNLPIFNCHRLA
ncbi:MULTISPECIES: nitrilase-related carbon-nitrogen hydrolase [Psychrobacter]|uniref:nitrilase-related carbon-nitrogen hydrolase n=1 Tax=Psychrobacter TaxID=497 RepID=UPI00146BDAC2|nr:MULTISPECIES: nitrilase-related carbon-nitrogen hydrolase [Psychrobacter]